MSRRPIGGKAIANRMFEVAMGFRSHAPMQYLVPRVNAEGNWVQQPGYLQ